MRGKRGCICSATFAEPWPLVLAVGQLEANSEGSTNLCVPDNSSYELISAQQYRVSDASAPPSGPNVVGIAVGVSVGVAALIAAAVFAAIVLVSRARRRQVEVIDKPESLRAVRALSAYSLGAGQPRICPCWRIILGALLGSRGGVQVVSPAGCLNGGEVRA